MDNIGLDTLGDKKTALFIIIPSTDSTYNFPQQAGNIQPTTADAYSPPKMDRRPVPRLWYLA